MAEWCACEHERTVHGDGEYWTSCLFADCECGQFRLSESPAARAAFRAEMGAGLRCKACGQRGHSTEDHARLIYGGPVCDCDHECSREGMLRRLYRKVFKK